MKYSELRTPSYIVQEGALVKNLEILKRVREEAGVKILLAEKAFSMYRVYPLIAGYLDGTTASGICEAKLAHEEFVRPGTREGARQGRGCPENHVFEPAYKPEEMRELCEICTHIYFNSLAQLELHRPVWEPYQKAGKIRIALRINPEFSTQEGHAIYDPCAPGSRLGIRRSQLPERLPEGVTGLHFHTLCEQDSDALEITLGAVAQKFGDVLPKMKWLNMGGGHHVTRPDYDIPRLERCIRFAQERWGVTVYLEPGEAWALNAGFLPSRVLDLTENNGVQNAILDCSAACHMPDVIEMPYQPPVYGGRQEASRDASLRTYRLGGPSCLSGDVIGDYEFDHALQIGDLVLFGDLAIYSTCKNNTFNGMPLPQIWRRTEDGTLEQLTAFGYRDFKYRLGR